LTGTEKSLLGGARRMLAAPVSVKRRSTHTGRVIGGGFLGLALLLAGIVGIDMAFRQSRGLDETERREAFQVFGNSLDYDKVRIAEDPIMGIGGYALTPGNIIYLPPRTTKDKDSPERRWWYYPLLIHEMTHAWQSQHGVSTMRKVLTALRGHSAYNYDGAEGLRKATTQGVHFVDFNTEQQASICADYISVVTDGGDKTPYEPFIAEVTNGGLPVKKKDSN
jgi:hypothetical protein